MKQITLKAENDKGKPYRAVFDPEKGMNMISYTLDTIEVMDQSTKHQFEQTYAGLGALIGPHFHRRPKHLIAKEIDEKTFPHTAHFKGDEHADPFTHGIGRYAPWNDVDVSESGFKAMLSGKDTWHGIALSELEGQDFTMHFNGKLTHQGLHLDLSVVSEKDSIVGIHYYYALNNGQGTVRSQIKNSYIVNNEKKPIPDVWNYDSQKRLEYPLVQDTDFTFSSYPDPLKGTIVLDTGNYELITNYLAPSEENSWQLWHPKGASFVCIEPVSSQDPRHPNLTVSSIQIQLEIVDKR